MSDSDERTTHVVELIKQTARQRFDCLVDSGAEVARIQNVAERFSEAIGEAYSDALMYMIKQLQEGKDDVA